MAVPLYELRRHALMPFQRFGREIKPGEQSDTGKHGHIACIGGGQNSLQRIRLLHAGAALIQLAVVKGLSVIGIDRHIMLTDIVLTIKHILNEHGGDTDFMHGIHVLFPVLVGHVFQAVFEIA